MSSNTRTRIRSFGLRIKTLSLAVASALLTINASAAGLGDLKVHSHLGQPLRAEVELVSGPSDGDAPLTVKLASYDVYQKASIEFNPLLHSLRFTTEQRGDRKVVRITSTQPINEPFVDMLLEVRTNNTSVVREYVFLLDPASLISAPVAGMEDEAASKAASSAARTYPVAQAEKPAAPARRAPAPKKPDTAQAAPEKAAAAAGKPRLTLTSPRAITGSDEIPAKEYAAMEQAVAEANARVVSLEKKVTELQKLLEVTNSLLAEMQRQKIVEPANAAPVPPVAATSNAAPPASAAVATPAPAEAKPAEPGATPAPAPAVAAAPKPAAPKPVAPPPEEDWGGNLLLLPGVALLLAGLGAVGLRHVRRRKQAPQFEDSLFASTQGAHSVRHPASTLAANLTSLLPSAMHSDEVDTVAEADVYIAYGRDGQAEDLLKEALRKKPGNRAVSMKLLTIYATRKDSKSFEPLALELHRATKGEGEDWAQIAEMGRGIDPDNPLYVAKEAASAPAHASTPLTAPNDDPVPIILEKIDADKPVTEQLADLGLDQPAANEDPAPASTKLTDEEEQLAELLSHPLSDDTEAKVDVSAPAAAEPDPDALDVDLLLKQLEAPVYQAKTPAEEAKQEAGIGPIDFDVIVPEIRIEQKEEAVPEIPSAMLETPKESSNLIEFDFLQPAKAEESKPESLPEIPLALPVDDAAPEDDAKLFTLEFADEKAAASDKR